MKLLWQILKILCALSIWKAQSIYFLSACTFTIDLCANRLSPLFLFPPRCEMQILAYCRQEVGALKAAQGMHSRADDVTKRGSDAEHDARLCGFFLFQHFRCSFFFSFFLYATCRAGKQIRSGFFFLWFAIWLFMINGVHMELRYEVK